ncbi:MAG: OB-fold domain-containing protein [Desulfatirhabdiaceae bacterium]|nr:OB-fold domain-containing protein [Desulfatirhabdiaceae bacterium]
MNERHQEEIEESDAEFYPSADSWVRENNNVFLIGSHCSNCGKHAFPQQSFCDECGNRVEFRSIRLSNTGTLYSFSEVYIAPKSFTVPYVIGYIDLPEGIRVCGQIDHRAEELKLEEPVEVVLGVIRTTEAGQRVISYKFRKKGDTSHA